MLKRLRNKCQLPFCTAILPETQSDAGSEGLGGTTIVVLKVFWQVSKIDGKPPKEHGGDCRVNYTEHSGRGVRLLE